MTTPRIEKQLLTPVLALAFKTAEQIYLGYGSTRSDTRILGHWCLDPI